MGYRLALDQGTTGTTSQIVDEKSLEIVGKANHEFTQYYPRPGWVEHDLDEIWKSVETSVRDVMQICSLSPTEITSIGITNQRETICLFDTAGVQLHRAVVWQDRRTGEFCSSNKDKEAEIKAVTGLPLDPYFSGTKIQWLLEHCSSARKALKDGCLRIGTIDTYLLYKLTNGKSYFTESTNASRTLLMNIHSGKWDQKLGDIFGIDVSLLPEVKDSFGVFGKTKGLGFLPDGIEINCMMGDQQSALIGQAGFKKGDSKCTYGTGAFILVNTGQSPLVSSRGLLTTISYRHKGRNYYALEGNCYIAGAAVQWLRDSLGIIEHSSQIEKLARSVKSLDHVENILMLPFFSGLGPPHWKPKAQASFVGLTRDSDAAHIARAVLEGIAFSVDDILTIMKEEDMGLHVEELRVDGGASSNNLLMDIQANISRLKIIRPRIIETTAYGAALGTFIGKGEMTFDDISQTWKQETIFEKNSEEAEYFDRKSLLWKEMVRRIYL